MPLPPPSAETSTQKELDAAMMRLFRSVRLLGSVTPINAAEERRRLVDAFGAGAWQAPAWRYAERDAREAAQRGRAADAILRAIEREGASASTEEALPLLAAYHDRARELSLECRLSESVGHAEFARHARERFSTEPTGGATELAGRWLKELAIPKEGPLILSDSNDENSLISQMKAAVGALRLPFRVSAHPSLAALAATGEETIVVAAGRMLSLEETARTVVHEVRGHAEPRGRARGKIGIFAFGTARGADEQEGLALVFERENGHLTATRKRTLGARHMAAVWMDEGASFVEVARRLMLDHDFEATAAVPIAERAFRGGDGCTRGLGRDVVYLNSFEKVARAIAAGARDVLTAGQVATEYVDLLRGYTAKSVGEGAG